MTSKRNLEITRIYKETDVSMAELAHRYGVSESRICQIVKAGGYAGKRKMAERKYTRTKAAEEKRLARDFERAKEDAKIAEMWTAGLTTFVIGEAMNLNPSVIGRRAKRMGLPQRQRGPQKGAWRQGPTTPPPPPTAEELEEMARSKQAEKETEPEAYQVHMKRKRRQLDKFEQELCTCGELVEVRCICGRMRCEDHIFMTSAGMRCEICMGKTA